MNQDDHPSAEEVAEASAEVALVANAAARPEAYISDERGVVEIKEMAGPWARNAAKAVQEGRRPADDVPGMVSALKRQARERGS